MKHKPKNLTIYKLYIDLHSLRRAFHRCAKLNILLEIDQKGVENFPSFQFIMNGAENLGDVLTKALGPMVYDRLVKPLPLFN